jgi:DNA-binding beta-propeller fold protein YncE
MTTKRQSTDALTPFKGQNNMRLTRKAVESGRIHSAIVTRLVSLLLAAQCIAAAEIALGAEPAALQLESTIPLGEVRGRIDHLAVDLGRQRLFVAELGNDTVGVIDLKQAKVIRTLAGLRAPQGIGYVPSTDTLFVANDEDGSVRIFRGPDFAARGRIALGDDADNVRVDAASRRVFVGYGSGGLAVIDADRGTKIADIRLKAHPESFRLDPSSTRIYVNVPDTHEIAVVDRATNRQTASWPEDKPRDNFPLALEESGQRLLVVFRSPAKLVVFRTEDGRPVASLDTCQDADDLFIDSKRSRIYVICGEGAIDVFGEQGDSYSRLDHIATVSGARTGLYVPELDRLFVAVRAQAGTPAAVWVYRPAP